MSSPGFPPRVLIEDGKPVHAVRIFGDERMSVVLCEFKLVSYPQISAVVDAIYEFAERHAIDIVIAIEGLPVDVELSAEELKLLFVSTSERFTSVMTKLSHEPLENSVLVGVSGLLLAEAPLRALQCACIVAPASSKFPDARSTVTAVRAIDAYLDGVDIDTAPLEEKSKKLHDGVQKLLAQEEQETSKAPSSMFM